MNYLKAHENLTNAYNFLSESEDHWIRLNISVDIEGLACDPRSDDMDKCCLAGAIECFCPDEWYKQESLLCTDTHRIFIDAVGMLESVEEVAEHVEKEYGDRIPGNHMNDATVMGIWDFNDTHNYKQVLSGLRKAIAVCEENISQSQ